MAKTLTTTRTSTPNDPIARRIRDLRRERAELEEEVLQLRAAVRVWTEVCRQTMSTVETSEAFREELR
jgi:hypothetical protein